MITNFYVFTCWVVTDVFAFYCAISTKRTITLQQRQLLRYSVYNHIVVTHTFGCYFGSSLQWYSFTLQTFLASYLIK